jgi:putative ABC transport system permease protein
MVAMTEFQWRVEREQLEAPLVLVLSILSLAVLCVACANVAGLLTGRAPLRAREIGVRLALGASRGRLIGQLLTESLSIALIGGLGGLAVGYAGIVLIDQIQFPTDMIVRPVMQMDQRVLVFSMIVALLSTVFFGLGPALHTTRIDLSHSLRTTDAGGRRQWRIGGRSSLVAVQVALSLALLTVAAIAYQTTARAFATGPGFRTTRLAKISLDASEAGYEGQRAARYHGDVLAAARQQRGVVSASVTAIMPMWGVEITAIVPEGQTRAAGQPRISPPSNAVDEHYFRTMDIPILRGRPFRQTDDESAALVAIVNETLAARHWPGVDAVGRRFRLHSDEGPWVQIVGVARNSTYLYPAEPPQEMLYLPFRQQPRGNMIVLAQTSGPSADPVPAIRDAIRAIDPAVPMYDVQTIEAFYAARATTIGSVVTSMFAGLGVMGMTLTVIGLYGLVSFAVARRTREIGIRMAIGATYGRVLHMLLRQGMAPAWVGLAVGMMLSAVAAAMLPALIPFTRLYDNRIVFLVTPFLLAVTLCAAFVPARRAARIDPSAALRHE